MPLEDNTCPLLPQPIMLTDTHCVSLVHVGAAGKQVPHHLYVAIGCSRVQRRTILQVSTNTRKRQPFEAFEVITEVCNRVCVCVCEVCACVRCVHV